MEVIRVWSNIFMLPGSISQWFLLSPVIYVKMLGQFLYTLRITIVLRGINFPGDTISVRYIYTDITVFSRSYVQFAKEIGLQVTVRGINVNRGKIFGFRLISYISYWLFHLNVSVDVIWMGMLGESSFNVRLDNRCAGLLTIVYFACFRSGCVITSGSTSECVDSLLGLRRYCMFSGLRCFVAFLSNPFKIGPIFNMPHPEYKYLQRFLHMMDCFVNLYLFYYIT